jgi:hypothetical protein
VQTPAVTRNLRFYGNTSPPITHVDAISTRGRRSQAHFHFVERSVTPSGERLMWMHGLIVESAKDIDLISGGFRAPLPFSPKNLTIYC